MGIYPSSDIERAAAAAEAAFESAAAVAGTAAAAAAEVDASAVADGALTTAGEVRSSAGAAAPISAVLLDSPAYDAGFEPGCFVTHVDGRPVRDIIDWRWLSSDDEISVGYIDLDGERGEVELEREAGEDWGFEFDGVVFDGVKQCRNACTFCFMRMLPEGMRPSLTLRDDDFRLSFLSGTFVTLTNLSAEDEERIVEQRISPLRVSLQAAGDDVRRSLMGRHAAHGLAALDRLLAAGIEVHAQIVLVPDENDGSELVRTLEWAYARPGILGIGIVPLGYTRHQTVFSRSFNEPHEARAVLGVIAPFQQRACEERGTPWVFAADEFYRNAFGSRILDNLPSADHYGDFSMFEDGIGIIRSFVDDWGEAEERGSIDRCARVLTEAGADVRFVVGEAMQPFFDQLVARGPLRDAFAPLVVENGFFGGNVDVTGLLCGCDIAAAVKRAAAGEAVEAVEVGEGGEVGEGARRAEAGERSEAGERVVAVKRVFALPEVVFNDDGLTLDGMTLEDIESAAGTRIAVVSCNPTDFVPRIAAIVAAEWR